MVSIKFYSEQNPLLKQWFKYRKLELDMLSVSETIKTNIEQEDSNIITISPDIQNYASDFLTVNEEKKKLFTLREKERSLLKEISAAEEELINAQKMQKNIIIIAIVLVAVIAICLLLI